MTTQQVTTEGFYSRVKRLVASHGPLLEVSENVSRSRKVYESKESRKESHRKWEQSPAGKASSARRGKKYRESHPEKAREKSNRFYARHREEILEGRRQKRLADPEGTRERRKKYPSESPERKREYNREYRKRKKLEAKALTEAA